MPSRNRTPLPIGTRLGLFEVISLPFARQVPGRSGQSATRNRYFVRLRCTGPDCNWEDDVREDDLTRRTTADCGFCHVSANPDPEARIHVERVWNGRQQAYDRYRFHGQSYSRLHKIWANMRERCSNSTSEKWERYGGRGITVDPAWENFRTFREWALDCGYADGLTIDRINNDRGYEPSNCRWVTDLENLMNRSRYLPSPLHEALEARALAGNVDTYAVIRKALESMRASTEQGSLHMLKDNTPAVAVSIATSRGPRVGFVSGRLTVVQVLDNRPKRSGSGFERWVLVECSCTDRTRKELRWTAVCSGNTRSCGCLAAERRKTRNLRHGESGTPLYRAWSAMKQRCSNVNIRAARRYSGQSIKVCPEWIDSYENFRDWANGHGYVEGKELDRIDNSRGYSPDNCRWVTKLENLANRAKYLSVDLENWLQEYAQEQGCIPYEIIKQALEKYLGVRRTGESQNNASS